MPEAVVTLRAAWIARVAAAAREADRLALIAAVDAIGREATGHRLCTAMRFDAAAMTVRRVYSSDPAAYPVGGAKPKRDTEWGRLVLHEHRALVTAGPEAIAALFDDHATIAGLGLRSIVNLPILRQGVCLGTLNFLWAEAAVTAERRAWAEALGLLATPAWG